jgi:uncharacterized protein (TIGR02598 family)
MKQHQPNKSAGFSLVEIVLTIGIVSFAFVGVIGLLPAGMGVYRSSMNTSIGAQIAQRVLNEAQQTEFSVLTGGNPAQPCSELIALRYYDEEGNELLESEAAKSLFHVHAIVQNAPAFPDSKGKNTVIMDELASVVVQVAINPAQRALVKETATMLWQSTANVSLQSYTVFVAHHD